LVNGNCKKIGESPKYDQITAGEQRVHKIQKALKKILLTIHPMGMKILHDNLQLLLKSSLAKESWEQT